MKKRSLKFHKSIQSRLEQTQVFFPVLLLLFFCFLLGSVLGCFVGSGVNEETKEITELISHNTAVDFSKFLRNFFTAGQYHMIALLAATSIIGVFIIPLLSFLRGYFLSCTAAAVIVSLPEKGIAAALISCGINALLTVPSLFLLELDGFGLSMRLKSLSSGKSYYFSNKNIPYHLGICAVCIIVAAAAECTLIPFLLSYIF